MTPERKNKLTAVLNKRQPDITVVMENIIDPHNIAAVMRSCDAIGIQEIYVINARLPKHENWGTRSSSGAKKWVTTHYYDHTEACLEEVKKHYDRIFTTKLKENAVDLYAMDFTGSVALVFGNEKHGISEVAYQYSDGNFVIPQMGMISSLNISVACAVTLYEAFRQKSLAGHYDQPRLPERTLSALKKEWKMYDKM